MTSRVRRLLCLKKKGTEVVVKGPILSWDSDELSAVLPFFITRVDSHGRVVTANGAQTVLYTPGSTHAPARPHVANPGLRLEEGTATAYATTAEILVQGPATRAMTGRC